MMNKENIERSRYVITPPVDIYETENEYSLRLDMPGVKKEDISITLNDGKLEIEGKPGDAYRDRTDLRYAEFELADYYRAFSVGHDVDPNGISATTDNGVLAITLRKREEAKPKKIEITVH